MPLSHFCMSCGGETVYTINKPRFCSVCGANFGETAASTISAPSKIPVFPIQPKTTPPPTYRPIQRLELEEDDVETQASLPQLEALDIDFKENKTKTTLGSVVAEHKLGIEARKPGKKLNKKKVLEEWQKEAGPRQPGSTIEIGE